MGWVYGVVTLILMAIFIGICIWAWRDKRQSDFAEAARLPLREDSEENNMHDKADS